MARLLILVEGQTEENFVGNLLGPHLYTMGYLEVSSRLMGKQRARHRRGGIRPWPEIRREIINHLRQDSEIIVSTFVDFYGLPSSGPEAWPGRSEPGNLQGSAKGAHVQQSMLVDLVNEMALGFNPGRFLPYVVMHEFEAMLFSDCEAFARTIDRPDLAASFQKVRDQVDTPEDINDSPTTAPSKRIEAMLPGYQKPLIGSAVAAEIGLPTIRAECPHFAEWLSRLERAVIQ